MKASTSASACNVLLVHAGDADIGEQVSRDEVAPAAFVMASDCACLLMQVNVGAGTITCNYGEAEVAALPLQQHLLLPRAAFAVLMLLATILQMALTSIVQ